MSIDPGWNPHEWTPLDEGVVPERSAEVGVAYRGASDHLDDLVHHLTLLLRRHVARYPHRQTDSGGQLCDLLVSLREASPLLRGSAGPTPEPWPDVELVDGEVAASSQRISARLEATFQANAADRIPTEALRSAAGLDDLDVTLLVAAAGPALSTDLARLYAFTWSDLTVKRPSVGFLAELVHDLDAPLEDVLAALGPNGRLARCRVLRIDAPDPLAGPAGYIHRSVSVPDAVIDALRGAAPRPSRGVRMEPAAEALPPEELLLAPGSLPALERSLTATLRQRCGRLVLRGAPGSGRRTALRSLLTKRRLGLVTLDWDSAEPERLDHALTAALLTESVALVRLPTDAEAPALSSLAEQLDGWPGLVALATDAPLPASLRRALPAAVEVSLAPLGAAQQREQWRRSLAAARVTTDHAALAEEMTRRIRVSPGHIARSVERAARQAALAGGSRRRVELGPATLTGVVRTSVQHGLRQVAEPIASALTFDDAVLPDDVTAQLREVLNHARLRDTVYRDWGFGDKSGYGNGLSCLFYGPPGTGKTMFSTILANELGREIYRVDLSRIMSKWVGETEKNLRRAFDEAERAQVILLFDEADALFSKRTGGDTAQDKFANLEVNYLLQRMEAYDGLAILTTNHEQNLDPALKRRLRFRIHFPLPGAALRARLWRVLLPEGAPVDGSVDFEELAERFELSGSHIRNGAIRGAFRAAAEGRAIQHPDLVFGAVKEAQSMGMAVRTTLTGESS